MTTLLLGLVLFLGVHSAAIVAPAWRARAIERVGPNAWKIGYSLVSAAGLALLIVGYGAARGLGPPLYVPPTGFRHLALLVMLPVFPLLFATYLPGRLSRAARHPMLLAVTLWALAHLLANGTPQISRSSARSSSGPWPTASPPSAAARSLRPAHRPIRATTGSRSGPGW